MLCQRKQKWLFSSRRKNKDDLIFSTEKSSDYLTVLKNNTIEQLDKIFEVDHNLKFDDESSRKNLESKLLEKAKAWNLNLKNDLQLQKKDEIIYHWPFFQIEIKRILNY